MRLKRGDLVRVRTGPDVAPELWDHRGEVLALLADHRLLVEVDTGDEVLFLPDQLVVDPGFTDGAQNPFDLFPGPKRTR